MLRFHRERQAAVTIATIEVPIEEAHRFGVVQVDDSDRVIGFQEKPTDPIPIPGAPRLALASMGIYIFEADVLTRALEADAARDTTHDFGQRHHPVADRQGPGVRLPVLRREQEGRQVLARHRHARRVLRGEHGPRAGEPGVQPVRSGVAAAHLPAAGAARQVRVRGRGSAVRTGARLDHLAGLHRVGQPHLGQHPVPERARPQLLRHRPQHSHARRPRRAPRQAPPRDRGPRRVHSARRPDRLQRGGGPAAPHGHRPGDRGGDARRRAGGRAASTRRRSPSKRMPIVEGSWRQNRDGRKTHCRKEVRREDRARTWPGDSRFEGQSHD